MLRKLKVDPASGWPNGVYFFGDDLLRVGIIVADELPRDRSTLLVRIMAAGPMIADLAALPAGAHERTVAEDVLVHLQQRLARKQGRTPEEEEIIVSMLRTWEKAREQGEAEGEAKGEARALLTALRARGIVVPDAARERILAERDPERLDRWVERAMVAASVAEVIDDPSRAA
jgi:hypothetical protein